MTFYNILKKYRTYSVANISINNINYDKKFIFIHIPKTAGTSLRVALNMLPFDHFTAQYFHDNYNFEFKRFIKFAFVRNPLSRFISLYNYVRMEESYYHSSKYPNTSMAGKHPFYETCHQMSVEQFIEYLVDPSNAFIFRNSQFLPQSNWFSLNGEIGTEFYDFVGKYENILEDTKLLSKLINVNIQLPYLNQSIKKFEKSQLSINSQALLQDYYAKDYELFKY